MLPMDAGIKIEATNAYDRHTLLAIETLETASRF